MLTTDDRINLAKHALLTYTKSEETGKNFSLENEETPTEVREFYNNLHVFEAGKKEIDYCHVFLNESAKKAVVAFRGTTSDEGKSLADWMNNMKQILVQYSKDRPDNVIHEGYNNSIEGLRSVKNKHSNSIEQLLNTWKAEGKATKIHITGHSKGGALAGLFAARISDVFGKENTHVVTFAAPKLGNEKFKEYYDSLVGEHHRYENVYDLVPQLPLVNMGLGRARALAIKTFIPAAKVLFQDTDDKFVHLGKRAVLSVDEKVKSLFSNIDENKYYKAAVAASFISSVKTVKFKFKAVPGECINQHGMEKYLGFLQSR